MRVSSDLIPGGFQIPGRVRSDEEAIGDDLARRANKGPANFDWQTVGGKAGRFNVVKHRVGKTKVQSASFMLKIAKFKVSNANLRPAWWWAVCWQYFGSMECS